jgi:ribosome-binding protein aMBF1 (putative translation factor)
MTLQEADKKIFKATLEVLSEYFTTIENERESIKETISDLSDQLGVDKKTIRLIAKAYHKGNFTDERKNFSDFEDLYEQIVDNP